MNKVFVMCGFPGSGKSTVAEKLAKEYNAIVFSSDALRKELYGSEEVQEHNEEVFQILTKRMISALQSGKNIIYDAMNISSKYRRNFLKSINRFECEKVTVLVATPYEECLRRNAARDRVVPEYVIKRAYMSFTVPCMQEGFSEVKIVYPEDTKFVSYIDLVGSMIGMPHDNVHHKESIGDHMLNAYNYLLFKKHNQDAALAFAAILHDIGKPFTKVFTNSKGELTEDAHYYGHNSVGAYDVLFTNVPEELKIEVALLIQYHMNYFMSWKQSEKAKLRDKEFLGEDLFNKIEILHECDINGR